MSAGDIAMDVGSKKQLWTGRVLSTLAVLFLLMDGVMKLLRLPVVVEATGRLGYPDSSIRLIGGIVLACTALYVIPPTAALGAVLLTGFLGGAVATNLRVGNPVFSHILFPVYLGAVVWAGLLLRRPQLVRSIRGA
jgi:DoxX-like protein